MGEKRLAVDSILDKMRDWKGEWINEFNQVSYVSEDYKDGFLVAVNKALDVTAKAVLEIEGVVIHCRHCGHPIRTIKEATIRVCKDCFSDMMEG